MHESTLIAAPLFPPASRTSRVIPRHVHLAKDDDLPSSEQLFRIHSADSVVIRESTNRLLKQRYGWRGYHTVSLPADQTVDRMTLAATAEGRTIGTITVGLDGPSGMHCESAFAAEIEGLRAKRLRVCEFTKLALDPAASASRVLVALFHVAYIVAHRLRGYDMVVMEVNPRHVRYYQNMLGGQILGAERLNTTVNAPAALLSIHFDYVAAQVQTFGSQVQTGAASRSAYALAFTPQEERGIISRLMQAQVPASLAAS